MRGRPPWGRWTRVYIHCPPKNDPNTLEHRSRTGVCTNLDDDDACPPTAGVDDEKWYPQYGGCRKKRCAHGRDSDGYCEDPPTTSTPSLPSDPTPPTDVEADGHSPTDSTDAGQSVVSWGASAAALQDDYTLARYEFRYGVVPDPSPTDLANSVSSPVVELLPDRWLPRDPADDKKEKPLIISASSTAHTVSGLTLYTLYRVEIQAVYTAPPITSPGTPPVPRPAKTSDWKHAYTYPTHDAVPSSDGEKIGVIPLLGFRPADPAATGTKPGQFRYVQCTNSYLLPLGISSADRTRLFSQVTRGIATWAAAYDEVDVIRKTPRECTALEVFKHGVQFARDEDNMKLHTNVVVFSSLGDPMKEHCGKETSRACAAIRPRDVWPIRSTKIVFHNGIEYKTNRSGLSCTTAWVTAMHEIGHAFGLGDTESSMSGNYGFWPTVMSRSAYDNCEPTALDIATLKAIYQSR